MFLLVLFVTSIQCSPVFKTPSANLIFFDSKNGVIFRRMHSIDQIHKFEYKFNLTIQQARGDPKKKCGKLSEENVTNEAWGKTMLNLRLVFYYDGPYTFGQKTVNFNQGLSTFGT